MSVQEIFVGHPQLVARQRPSEFRYAVTRLFELYNQDTEGLTVTGVAWNGKDRTILAAGYGCYLLSDDPTRGLVCCWSIKNPFQPERIYRMDRCILYQGRHVLWGCGCVHVDAVLHVAAR